MSAGATVHAPIAGASRLSPARFGIWLFLVSEAMFFAALISAYLVLRSGSSTFGSPGDALSATSGACATFVLVASSACAWRAFVASKRQPSARSSTWILATLALGAAFLAIQGLEYRVLIERGLSPRTNLYWSSFFVLTSLHALHVFGGLLWLALVRRNPDDATRALRIELAVLYWQLVDFVWLALFALLYF